MSDFCELTTDPIDITSVARRVVPPECGATVTLDGYARRFTKKKPSGEVRETEYLVYEAYDEMAIKEMEKLVAEAKGQFEISNVGIVHRTGRLEIGETSVPIWKKEVYADSEQWIEGDAEAVNAQPRS
jgi:molybdopterin synthase catalytic subunit